MKLNHRIVVIVIGIAMLIIGFSITMSVRFEEYKLVQSLCHSINYTMTECICYNPGTLCRDLLAEAGGFTILFSLVVLGIGLLGIPIEEGLE